MREEKRLQKVTLMNARYSDVDMQELLSAAFTEIEKRRAVTLCSQMWTW